MTIFMWVCCCAVVVAAAAVRRTTGSHSLPLWLCHQQQAAAPPAAQPSSAAWHPRRSCSSRTGPQASAAGWTAQDCSGGRTADAQWWVALQWCLSSSRCGSDRLAGLSPLRSENGSVLYGVGRATVSIYSVLSFDICSAGNDARGSLLTRRCCRYVLLMCAEQLVCQGRPAVADPLS